MHLPATARSDSDAPLHRLVSGAFALLLAATGCIALPGAANAQAWPARPIRVVVPYPPGGTTDVLARTRRAYDRGLPAGGGQLQRRRRPTGTDVVAKAAPDGYTPGAGQQPRMRPMPRCSTGCSDLLRTSAGGHGGEPRHVIVVPVRPRSRSPTWYAGAAAARTTPVRLGSAAPDQRLAARAGMDAPMPGANPAVTDLLGGQVDLMTATLRVAHHRRSAARWRRRGAILRLGDVLRCARPMTDAWMPSWRHAGPTPSDIVGQPNAEVAARCACRPWATSAPPATTCCR
jgi:hypothetical protein